MPEHKQAVAGVFFVAAERSTLLSSIDRTQRSRQRGEILTEKSGSGAREFLSVDRPAFGQPEATGEITESPARYCGGRDSFMA